MTSGLDAGDRRMTVTSHRRAAWDHARLALMWERDGEGDLASVERSRATIHTRAADIKRELEAQEGHVEGREVA